MKKKSYIEISSALDLNQLRENMQSQLTTQELISFALNLGENFYEERAFLLQLRDQLNKIDFGGY